MIYELEVESTVTVVGRAREVSVSVDFGRLERFLTTQDQDTVTRILTEGATDALGAQLGPERFPEVTT